MSYDGRFAYNEMTSYDNYVFVAFCGECISTRNRHMTLMSVTNGEYGYRIETSAARQSLDEAMN